MSTKTPKTKFGKQMLYILLPFVLPLCLIILGIVLLANAKVVNGIFLALGILIAWWAGGSCDLRIPEKVSSGVPVSGHGNHSHGNRRTAHHPALYHQQSDSHYSGT